MSRSRDARSRFTREMKIGWLYRYRPGHDGAEDEPLVSKVRKYSMISALPAVEQVSDTLAPVTAKILSISDWPLPI